MAITLKDIAKKAGVTSATVSMVINNKPNISSETREKVLRIAKEMCYYPNAIARGLATNKTNAIGVIVPNLASAYVIRILQGIKSTNRDVDYTVQLFDTVGQKEREHELFNRLVMEKRIDGAILIDASGTDEEMSAFKNSDVPCISVARKSSHLDSIFVNNIQGACDATDYLISKGHQAIACVICSKDNLPTEDRLKGFRDALSFNDVEYREELLFEVENDTMSDGEKLFEKIKKLDSMPTAIFVPAGDMVAIGIIKAAKKSGLKVPDDLAVIGFDDLPAAEVIEPALTTIRQPKLEMGDNAIGLITDKIEDKIREISSIELPTKLIIRESA